MKRIALVGAVVLIVCSIAAAILARRVLTGDNVRAAIASQLSHALGQPVTIATLGASIYPRVTMDLGDVTIGGSERMRFTSMHLETGLRALFSRRIEGATVRVDGARIGLPLPSFGEASPGPSPAAGTSAPVEIVSIDEIRFNDVEIVSGDRTVRGDVALVPEGRGVRVQRIALNAEGMQVEMTGTLTSLSPVDGRIEAKAGAIDLDRLLGFLDDFMSGATAKPQSPGAGSTTSAGGRLALALTADRVTTGGMTLSEVKTTATVVPGSVTFDPLTFGIFGGRYEGSMQAALGEPTGFRWRAKVDGLDAAALMAFAGSPDTITGSLAGTIALDGRGLQMEQALRSAHGNARVEITDGTIKGLALVRTVVTAGSGRGGLATSVSSASGGSERFSRLGASLNVAAGRITTNDFAMHSPDVDLTAAGSMRLDSMTTDFAGRAQLSETLSKQAGTDLYRYTQDGGRVTLPVTVTGPIAALDVRVDLGEAAARALRNKAEEEATKAIERNLPKGLKGIFKKGGGGSH